MLTGLNSYNSSVQYNNRPRFGQLTTNAARAEAIRIFKIATETPAEEFSTFVANQINGLARKDRKAAPAVYKELAIVARDSKHWTANLFEEIAKRASKW